MSPSPTKQNDEDMREGTSTQYDSTKSYFCKDRWLPFVGSNVPSHFGTDNRSSHRREIFPVLFKNCMKLVASCLVLSFWYLFFILSRDHIFGQGIETLQKQPLVDQNHSQCYNQVVVSSFPLGPWHSRSKVLV